MIILLDCDGPLSNFTHHYLSRLNEICSLKDPSFRVIEVDEIDQFEIHKTEAFSRAASFLEKSENDLKKLMALQICSYGFTGTMPIQPWAKKLVDGLRKKHEVVALTSPWVTSQYWAYERHHWLKRELEFQNDEIIQTNRKELVSGDHLIDDKFSHCDDWSRTNGAKTAFLFDMHHNREGFIDLAPYSVIYRVNAEQILERLA